MCEFEGFLTQKTDQAGLISTQLILLVFSPPQNLYCEDRRLPPCAAAESLSADKDSDGLIVANCGREAAILVLSHGHLHGLDRGVGQLLLRTTD